MNRRRFTQTLAAGFLAAATGAWNWTREKLQDLAARIETVKEEDDAHDR